MSDVEGLSKGQTLKERLKYHVTGAIERGEAQAITEERMKIGDRVKNVGYDVRGGPPLGSLGTVVALRHAYIGVKWDGGRYGLDKAAKPLPYHLHIKREVSKADG